MQVSRVLASCNIQLIANETVLLKPKQSKLKKNRMQAKNEAIQLYTSNLVDISLSKERRRQTALNRRQKSK